MFFSVIFAVLDPLFPPIGNSSNYWLSKEYLGYAGAVAGLLERPSKSGVARITAILYCLPAATIFIVFVVASLSVR